jgi:hypothetical protein
MQPRISFARRCTVGAVGIAASIAVSQARAATCFSAFSGGVHYNFADPLTSFTTPGTYSTPGVLFGSLSSCAGLAKWPIVGTVTVTATSVVLAFRALTVDAAGCGATDNIVSLTPKKLSGTLQLHNDRNNFSNSSAFANGVCTTPPPEGGFAPTVLDAKDSDGN